MSGSGQQRVSCGLAPPCFLRLSSHDQPAESETSQKRAAAAVGPEVRRSPACSSAYAWCSVHLVDRCGGWRLGGQASCGCGSQKRKPSRKVALRRSSERSPKMAPTP
ncbi:hypothetical protein NDU88_006967 [Pleurodeles waltl]|uniref:Uncharacterized protein n=1 Tax=Pleurodeles waltl TaxID=8319 RepID=A0AAV7RTF0_PLEWA|nr:hypothetical protein NDU88_006967 [Pleurodeles waltl]